MEIVLGIVAGLAVVGWFALALRHLFARTDDGAALRSSLVRPSALLVGVPFVAVALLVGAPFAYIQWGEDDPPPPLSFDDVPAALDDDTTSSTRRSTTSTSSETSTSSTMEFGEPFVDPLAGGGGASTTTAGERQDLSAQPSEISGRWAVGSGSQAGYRTEEVLVAQNRETAGRTNDVSGEMRINGMTVESANFVVNMQTVTSDNEQRDGQFHGRIMDTQRYPTSEFVLTRPIAIDSLPPDGESRTYRATGTFTIRGKTREVSFDVQARRNAGRIEVLGRVPVRWEEYDIPDPSTPFAQVEDHGEIEFLLLLYRQIE